MKVNWNKVELEKIILESKNQKEALQKLGLRSAGANFKTLKKYLKIFDISTNHFLKNNNNMILKNISNKKNISEILVENSKYDRGHLKNRLFKECILENICCLCNQDENWNRMKISLILDHINGIYDDNRLENLRIVCPNCNAGLSTHCRGEKKINVRKICECGGRKDISAIKCSKCSSFNRRKVSDRPDKEILIKEVSELGYSATGRKYGVSDNAIRKWTKY